MFFLKLLFSAFIIAVIAFVQFNIFLLVQYYVPDYFKFINRIIDKIEYRRNKRKEDKEEW